MIDVVEINADNQISAHVLFDPDDFDAAIAELDARYLAGEAAAHAHTWSLIAPTSAGFNRHELAATTPNLVTIDHRRAAAFEPGDLTAYIHAGWDMDQGSTTYIEDVHRLSNLGAVVTYAGSATSQEGFDAEWRVVDILTIDGDLFNRCEIFDEADLDAALARFDELSRPAPRLENAASRVLRALACVFRGPRLERMAEMLADDHYSDDRRRVIDAGIRRRSGCRNRETCGRGRRVRAHELDVVSSSRPVASASPSVVPVIPVEISDRRRFTSRPFDIIEIDADERIAALVTFDLDDIDAAFEELDARYLAGEAAAYAHTWSVIADTYAAFNRRELPDHADWVSVDHRRGSPFAPGDLDRNDPCLLGPHTGPQHLHRGCASAQRPRSGRHQCVAWDLARGLRRRVADGPTSDGRRRP